MKMALLLLSLVLLSTSVYSSPSETNYFYMFFEGEDAERFKNTPVVKSSSHNNDLLIEDYSFAFSVENPEGETLIFLNISCQQRTYGYQTDLEKVQDPRCWFVYEGPYSFTSIEMTKDIAVKFFKNMKWTKFKSRDAYYFGCWDGMEAGCPPIRYTPKSNKREAYLDLRFFKP